MGLELCDPLLPDPEMIKLGGAPEALVPVGPEPALPALAKVETSIRARLQTENKTNSAIIPHKMSCRAFSWPSPPGENMYCTIPQKNIKSATEARISAIGLINEIRKYTNPANVVGAAYAPSGSSMLPKIAAVYIFLLILNTDTNLPQSSHN